MPITYWRENVTKSLSLFEALHDVGQTRVLFSSTAAVYAVPSDFEVGEDDPVDPQSPYARSKRAVEMALQDITAGTTTRAITLRYFNPIGSDPAYRSGVYDRVPSHVIGQLVAAATGKIDSFTLTGVTLPTRDGTGVRDYIHAWDLAEAHVRAVEQFDAVLAELGNATYGLMNVGTGHGTTVRELVAAFERVSGREVPIREAPPRPGDIVGAFANVDRAAQLMGWRARFDIDEAIASALEWEDRRERILGSLQE
jgi:UDP-glucose 4-epimerase